VDNLHLITIIELSLTLFVTLVVFISIMAYNNDAVLAKLSSLNESQDSIVSVAQWIMFHRFVLLNPPPLHTT